MPLFDRSEIVRFGAQPSRQISRPNNLSERAEQSDATPERSIRQLLQREAVQIYDVFTRFAHCGKDLMVLSTIRDFSPARAPRIAAFTVCSDTPSSEARERYVWPASTSLERSRLEVSLDRVSIFSNCVQVDTSINGHLKKILDTSTSFFGHRLRASIQRKGFTKESFAEAMGVSRATLYNWFEREDPPPSKPLRAKMSELLKEPEGYLFQGVTESKKTGHLKQGLERAVSQVNLGAPYGEVASRIPQDQRVPATEADVEAYFQALKAAAFASDDPNAFPVIMHRLRKHLPLDEWQKPE